MLECCPNVPRAVLPVATAYHCHSPDHDAVQCHLRSTVTSADNLGSALAFTIIYIRSSSLQMRRPSVLVCNDDGIQAPGVRALVNELISLDICDVSVCCPATEQSGKSQSITIGDAIVTRRLCSSFPGAARCFEVHGTPAHAVMVATCSDLFRNETHAP